MKQKGITLIALIITIVVLLILSSIAISILIGENGIQSRAYEAKKQTEIAEIIERIRVDILGIQSQEEGKITEGQLREILVQYFKNVPYSLPEELIRITLETKDEYGGHEINLSTIYNGKIRKKR